MRYFQPKRVDGRSYRDVVVDLFKIKSPGDIITYPALAAALELNNRGVIQQSALAANKVLLKLYRRGIKNVRNVGYRVIAAREHMIVAAGHESKAERQLVRMVNFLDGARIEEMSDVERQLHLSQSLLSRAMLDSHRFTNRRIDRLEELLRGGRTIEPDAKD